MATNDKYLHSEITNSILQAFYTTIKKLPYGLHLDIYKNALSIECELVGLKVDQNKEIIIRYRDKQVGSVSIDLLVENSVIVKVIQADAFNELHDLELKNQLRLTEYEVGLLVNIDLEGQHKRTVLTNDLKRIY